MAEVIPLALTAHLALRHIREVASDTDNIVVISHGIKRGRQRGIGRREIELCVQRGLIEEGPFVNDKGNWQVTMRRQAAGEELVCVVAIDWPSKLLVITTYRRR